VINFPKVALVDLHDGRLLLSAELVSFSFVEPPPLRGVIDDVIFDDASFSGEATWHCSFGDLARADRRAGRNKRKALRRARGGR
jgi:hypothetical protein